MTNLRNMIRSRWWWVLVVVVWLVWTLGILQVRDGSNLGFPIAIGLTILVVVMQTVSI